MGYTKAQKDSYGICGAKKKNRDLCRNFAGLGTPHKGVGRCKYHLGNAPNHLKAAVRQQAEKEILKARGQFGDVIPVEPTEALLSVLHLSAGQLAWLHAELSEREDKTDFDGQVLMRLWNDERDRVARISEAALRAAVQERAIRLAESYGEQLAVVLRAIFYDPELDLDEEQLALLPTVLRRHLFTAEQPALVAAGGTGENGDGSENGDKPVEVEFVEVKKAKPKRGKINSKKAKAGQAGQTAAAAGTSRGG